MKILVILSLLGLFSCATKESQFFKHQDVGYTCSKVKSLDDDEEACLPVDPYKDESIMMIMQPWELRRTKPMPDLP